MPFALCFKHGKLESRKEKGERRKEKSKRKKEKGGRFLLFFQNLLKKFFNTINQINIAWKQ
jgi:hypothetical protein